MKKLILLFTFCLFSYVGNSQNINVVGKGYTLYFDAKSVFDNSTEEYSKLEPLSNTDFTSVTFNFGAGIATFHIGSGIKNYDIVDISNPYKGDDGEEKQDITIKLETAEEIVYTFITQKNGSMVIYDDVSLMFNISKKESL